MHKLLLLALSLLFGVFLIGVNMIPKIISAIEANSIDFYFFALLIFFLMIAACAVIALIRKDLALVSRFIAFILLFALLIFISYVRHYLREAP